MRPATALGLTSMPSAPPTTPCGGVVESGICFQRA
jgi:hypothetical protein